MKYKVYLNSIKTPLVVTNEQAKFIKEKMRDPMEVVTIGFTTFKVSQIKSIIPEEEPKQGKDAIRQELQRVAKACGLCEGTGFVNVGNEIRDLCECQKRAKEINGIEPYDFDKLHNEFDMNA